MADEETTPDETPETPAVDEAVAVEETAVTEADDAAADDGAAEASDGNSAADAQGAACADATRGGIPADAADRRGAPRRAARGAQAQGCSANSPPRQGQGCSAGRARPAEDRVADPARAWPAEGPSG